MRRKYLWAISALLLLSLLIAAAAQAAAVGRFSLVEGQVQILKQGKVPAAAARAGDGVESGDVIRTKSRSKAQVKFVDDSVVTLAPDSRMAVADFSFDAATGARHAVLRFYKGVIHTLVTRALQVQKSDYIMETHTAVLGVRGTENYTVMLPNATAAYLIDGLLEVGSNNPQVAEKVLLKAMEFTIVPLGLPPRMPRIITPAMLQMLKKLMDSGLGERAFLSAGTEAGVAGVPQIPEIPGLPGDPERYMQPVIPPRVVPPAIQPPVQAPVRVQPQVTPGPTP